MAETEALPRTSGMPAPSSRQSPLENGSRSETAAPRADMSEDLSHQSRVDERVTESNQDSDFEQPAATGPMYKPESAAPRANYSIPLLAGAAALSAATTGLLIIAGRRLSRRGGDGAAVERGTRPAFKRASPDPENFNQTRDAGPEHIRDNSEREWDQVDESSDESFPASDPPSSY